MKMYMISLGCAKNQVDSEMIVGFMQQKMEKEAIRTYHVVDKAATHEEAQMRMEK